MTTVPQDNLLRAGIVALLAAAGLAAYMILLWFVW